MDMSDIQLEPISRPFTATMRPPGSKSLTNRALVLAALAEGACELDNVLFAEDTQVMLESLARLGFELSTDPAAAKVRVAGRGGMIPSDSAELFCGNSGTTIRFLTALCALGRGRYTLDGIPRMRQRPIGPLVIGLAHLGARASYLIEKGFPPVVVMADRLPGGLLKWEAAASSQFLSAILMIGPYARHELSVDLVGKQSSWPYVAMTMRLMDIFGSTPELIRDPRTQEPKRIIIPQGRYGPTTYSVEPDASSASYFLAAAAINPGSKISISGLGKSSLQGDVAFADVLHSMGADLVFGSDFITLSGPNRLQGIETDLTGMPDMAQTLAVAALFAEGPTTITGLSSLRLKETDRLAALSAELTRLGANVEIEDDATLVIEPPTHLNSAAINTYDDHRMAMSFALAATRRNGIVIKDVECVAKSYPRYFDDLRNVLATTVPIG